MNYSLAWLREPDMEHALPDLITGMIREIRLILVHPDLGNAAKLAAITSTVDLLAPPPGPRTGSLEACGTEGGIACNGTRAAGSVVALLARNAGPATLLFEELVGERIHIELADRADRVLTAAESLELHASPDTIGHYRAGRLRAVTSGLVAADVRSTVLPWRLPEATRRELGIPEPGEPALPRTDVPLGKALAGLGVRREPLGAHLVRNGASDAIAVESSARMWLGDLPVALASERVTAQLCQRAGARLSHPALGPA
jgi:hypothetical protein